MEEPGRPQALHTSRDPSRARGGSDHGHRGGGDVARRRAVPLLLPSARSDGELRRVRCPARGRARTSPGHATEPRASAGGAAHAHRGHAREQAHYAARHRGRVDGLRPPCRGLRAAPELRAPDRRRGLGVAAHALPRRVARHLDEYRHRQASSPARAEIVLSLSFPRRAGPGLAPSPGHRLQLSRPNRRARAKRRHLPPAPDPALLESPRRVRRRCGAGAVVGHLPRRRDRRTRRLRVFPPREERGSGARSAWISLTLRRSRGSWSTRS